MEEEGKVIRVVSLRPYPRTVSLGASVMHCEQEH